MELANILSGRYKFKARLRFFTKLNTFSAKVTLQLFLLNLVNLNNFTKKIIISVYLFD